MHGDETAGGMGQLLSRHLIQGSIPLPSGKKLHTYVAMLLPWLSPRYFSRIIYCLLRWSVRSLAGCISTLPAYQTLGRDVASSGHALASLRACFKANVSVIQRCQ